jgi:hypothetical protein
VTITATRRARQGRHTRTVTFATASRRTARAGLLPLTLAASRTARRGLPAGRVPLHLHVRFTPAGVGLVPPLQRTLAATLAPAKPKGRK